MLLIPTCNFFSHCVSVLVNITCTTDSVDQGWIQTLKDEKHKSSKVNQLIKSSNSSGDCGHARSAISFSFFFWSIRSIRPEQPRRRGLWSQRRNAVLIIGTKAHISGGWQIEGRGVRPPPPATRQKGGPYWSRINNTLTKKSEGLTEIREAECRCPDRRAEPSVHSFHSARLGVQVSQFLVRRGFRSNRSIARDKPLSPASHRADRGSCGGALAGNKNFLDIAHKRRTKREGDQCGSASEKVAFLCTPKSVSVGIPRLSTAVRRTVFTTCKCSNRRCSPGHNGGNTSERAHSPGWQKLWWAKCWWSSWLLSLLLLPRSISFSLPHRPNQANDARTSSIPSCSLKCQLIGGVGKLLTREEWERNN